VLTGTRPMIDPRILGSAIGDLFPENQNCHNIIDLIVTKKEKHSITMKIRINMYILDQLYQTLGIIFYLKFLQFFFKDYWKKKD
jgi:hypothetical protein